MIGAGIVGASCAFHLAERGAHVTVLDRAPVPATGSTGRSAGGIRVQFSHVQNVAMSLHSFAAFDAFEKRHGVDAGYRRVGYLFLLAADDVAPWCVQQAAQRAAGARVLALSKSELANRFPYVDSAGLAGGSLGLDDGVLDPSSVTSGYLASAKRLGADLRFSAEVTRIGRHGDAWRIETDGDTILADAVVNAAGPQAAAVAELAGFVLPVAPVRRVVYVTAPLEGIPKPTPLVVDLTTGVYLRSEGERFLFGRSNPDEPSGENLAVDWQWLEPTLELALPRFPFLGAAELDRRACWAGLYAMTPDHLPILGAMPGANGWLNACGFSGHGVQHAPATGLAIAEEALEGGATTFDLTDFRFDRFSATVSSSSRERNVV